MSKAHIDFEIRARLDPEATEAKGYNCYNDVDFAIIYAPGDKFLVVEQEVDAARLKYWQENAETRYRVDAYHAWKSGREAPLHGTPLREWPVATPSEIRQLESLHVKTVEDLGDLNEDALRRYGIGGQRLKQKAQAWIAAGADKGKIVERVSQQEQILENLMKQVEEMNKQNAEKDDMIRKLIASQQEEPKKSKKEAA